MCKSNTLLCNIQIFYEKSDCHNHIYATTPTKPHEKATKPEGLVAQYAVIIPTEANYGRGVTLLLAFLDLALHSIESQIYGLLECAGTLLAHDI